MSIITTFPTVVPELNDLVLGTKIKEGGNTTKNFRIGEVLALINSGEVVPPTVNYGLFSQTEDSVAVTNTQASRPLYGAGVGSKIIAANTLAEGDSFNISMMGTINSLVSASLTITVTTPTGVTLGTTGAITLPALTNKNWSLNFDFTVREPGIAGVASIITGGDFLYQGGSAPFIFNLPSTFDTTVSNEIIILVQWGASSASNSIYSRIANFKKTY
jgi:hypothetical protein